MMNDFAETRAFAKVNLTLDVLKKRADGYHELSTVMQTIDLYDELYADFSHEDIAVTADFDLPEGSVVGVENDPYGVRALVRRDMVPHDLPLEHTNLEDIILFLAKGGTQK